MTILGLCVLMLAGVAAVVAAGEPGRLLTKAQDRSTVAAIFPEVTETGEITLSVDGLGTTSSCALIQVDKPSAAATVRGAYFMAASTPSAIPIPDGAITIDGTASPAWLITLTTTINTTNYWTDVTAIVAAIVDPAVAGIIDIEICELTFTPFVDGTVLAVIFDDPGAPEKTVALLFGAQDIAGDSFSLSLSEPLDLLDPDVIFDMSLGISFGFQGILQVSHVDVATSPGGPGFQRLTSSAGGQDDGLTTSNALITVGGIGDTNGNPPPLAPPTTFNDPDDELYNLLPFYTAGDLLVTVNTINPSDDDNIFFAAFCISGKAQVTVGCAVVPSSHDFGPVAVGNTACTSFDIVNTSDSTLAGFVSETCDEYTIVSGGGAYSLPDSGDTHSVTVCFSPTVVGDFHCDIRTGNQNCPVFEAWGVGDATVPVALQHFESRWTGGHVEVAWGLIDINAPVSTEIFRKVGTDISYARLHDATIDQASNSFTFRDYNTEPGNAYSYRVVIKENGDPVAQFVASINTPGARFDLQQNQPNPFNPTTSIPFTLSGDHHVTLSIYDIAGRLVATLIDRGMSAGAHMAQWDGRSLNGNPAGSGVYFYRLKSGSDVTTRKAVLMK